MLSRKCASLSRPLTGIAIQTGDEGANLACRISTGRTDNCRRWNFDLAAVTNKKMIRRARIQEAEILTKISFSAKGYWNYPKEFYEKWSNELTISSDYIQNNAVFVFEKDGNIIGYYSIVELKNDIEIADIKISKGFWLEHMFIEPQSIGKGIGTKLFQHLRKWCTSLDVYELGILADPHSRGFYDKMGCEYMLEYPSTIKNRTTPYFQLKIRDR